MGCGCRGRALAAALAGDGHAVRGTTRDPARAAAIEKAGAEAIVADPGRLATLTPQLEGATAICWLMGTAAGDRDAIAALHGARLEAIVDHIVDTPVRGVVYEAAGTVAPKVLEAGAAALRRASATYRMPAEVVTADPAEPDAWLQAMRRAAARVLA